MKFSSNFHGWIGKIADEFTFSKLIDLALLLAEFYKKNSTSGQKLVIGYDTRFLAQESAQVLACLMAENGIRVFISNKPAPSAVLITTAKHKKSMGTVVLTGDTNNATYLGLRCYDAQGHFLQDHDLEEKEEPLIRSKKNHLPDNAYYQKFCSKGIIEPFEPSICFTNQIEGIVDFSAFAPAINFIMFSPLHGSGMFYFDYILQEKTTNGYTCDREKAWDLRKIEPHPALHVEGVYAEMMKKGAELGFITSPDCSIFRFLIGPHALSEIECIYFIAESLSKKGKHGKILLSEDLKINVSYLSIFGMDIEFVENNEFYKQLKDEEHLFAVSNQGEFYFRQHGAPDALLCGFLLHEYFNDKELTYAKIENKLKSVRGISQ